MWRYTNSSYVVLKSIHSIRAGEAVDSRILRSADGVGGDGAITSFLPVPPVSILLDQELIETLTATSDGVQKKKSYLNQKLFAATCSADKDHGLTLYPLDIEIRLESPAAGTHFLYEQCWVQ